MPSNPLLRGKQYATGELRSSPWEDAILAREDQNLQPENLPNSVRSAVVNGRNAAAGAQSAGFLRVF